jgi:hypothetical protein
MRAAKTGCMLIFAIALTAPTPLTEIHQRNIACVVEIAIVADEQKRGVPGSGSFPDVAMNGKRWAGLVGSQIVDETGQPREIVAFAMTEAAKARQARVRNTAEVAACIGQMNSDLAIADAKDAPLPKPVKAQ